ncbi:MAG: M6 family metalloprotease domain-containing protein [Phycisphaerales bacterium]|nr:M6 family metalloprotease domain-containing protein [Phycisphaerales bacterium]
MLQRTPRRGIAALAIAIAPTCLLLTSPFDIQATTAPAPGVTAPKHVVDHAKRSQVTLDDPGAWRGKAKAAKANREAGFRSNNAVTGVLEVPVICFGYNNIALPVNTVPDLQQELFDGPWPTGTLSEYYLEISYNKFTFDGQVLDVGALANNDNVYEGGQNGLGANQPFVYVNEALDLADGMVDFGIYDNDGPDGIPNSGDDDGIVDLVALVHPEIGGECGNGNLWSHRWTYASANFYANNSFTRYSTGDPSANGGMIEIDDYTLMPALSCGNSLIEIGVFCHEFGHALGLPDLYGRSPSINAGCGHFCLMASGNWNQPDTPAHMSAWCRAEMGWVQPQLLIGDYTGLSIPAVEVEPFALKIQHDPDSSEYMLIENRQPIGFDQHLHGCGLAIWHIDPAVGTGNDNGWCGGAPNAAHSFIALEQADGLCEMEWGNRGDDDDLWSAAGPANAFGPNTFPSSRPYSGVDTGFDVSNISLCAHPMTADIFVNPLPITEPRELDVLFIFDVSGSYWDDMPEMLAQMPSVISAISADFPNPRFGVASFKDFPVNPVGSPSDYAWNIDLDFNANATAVTNAMSSLVVSGGNDLPESQYEAVYQAMTGAGLDLNNDGDFLDPGEIAAQLPSWDATRAPIIFLMTDADFHDADLEDYPPGAGEAHGRIALLNELAAPSVMAEAPRVFTLNAAWGGPEISSGAWGGGDSDDPGDNNTLHHQATELGEASGGKLIYAGNNTVEFLEAIQEALDVIEGDIPTVGTCCTNNGECVDGVTRSWCTSTIAGVWTTELNGCEKDCNQNWFPDSCEIALGITQDENGNGIPDECECPGDVDGNGVVNVDDMLKIIGNWGCQDSCPNSDVNDDGVTDINDLLLVFDSWGTCAR